ncbi:MAG: glycosyltransferase family 4 protein [Chloroflexi bacterium]|nr:glycosyltransferase family 4 protein [Chloroflexota bacterium]MCC6891275.1 glycosyltransferase family 4 protein [Anaerolineae bacterium]
MVSIGIDYTPAYEQGGGIGRYVRELVSALAKVDQDTNYSLFVAGVNGDLPPQAGRNFVWKPTHITPKWFARIWHRARVPIPVQWFVGSVDLFHATDFVLPPTSPAIPTVLTVHDLSYVHVPESASPALKKYLDVVVPRSIQHSTFILADSEATRNDIVSLYGTSPEKVCVLLSGVSSVFKQINDTDLSMTTRRKYNLDDFQFIFTVGTVQPRKNYTRLIEALGILHSHGIKIHLVISGGKGWLDNPIYETIAQRHMEEYVHFIGFADDADLPVLYNMAACLAFPSLYEGFGLPILEAMACGAPVVTSNVSSLPEVAGDAGLLVDPYDVDALANALQSLIQDEPLRQQLIEKGLERVKEFTWEKSARQLLGIYQTLLA